MPRCQRCRAPILIAWTGRRRRYCSNGCRQAQHRRRAKLGILASSQSSEWTTPPTLFAKLNARYGPFTLDPCATPENALCEHYYTRAENGLTQSWTGKVFLNPPYGRGLSNWLRKTWESVTTGEADLVCCLLPARTDTSWWHEWVVRGEVEFLSGRLHFGGAQNGAPFPSAVVVFRNGKARYETRRK
jgi:site-specific DNA-methyltransferase (adenine-specific)